MYSSGHEHLGKRSGAGDQQPPYPAPSQMISAPPQPYSLHHPHGHTTLDRWSTGLCHCCDDPASCLITCICPCLTFGQIAEIINKGAISCAASGAVYGLLCMTGLSCLYSCFYRSRLRSQYDLEETPCADCLVHFCCEPCALCQEYRELKAHGFDMGIGWEANMNRQGRGLTSAPVVGGMMR